MSIGKQLKAKAKANKTIEKEFDEFLKKYNSKVTKFVKIGICRLVDRCLEEEIKKHNGHDTLSFSLPGFYWPKGSEPYWKEIISVTAEEEDGAFILKKLEGFGKPLTSFSIFNECSSHDKRQKMVQQAIEANDLLIIDFEHGLNSGDYFYVKVKPS